MEVYRKRDADLKRQPNDQGFAEELTLKVAIDAKAEMGKRRDVSFDPRDMSNPIWFQVGRWKETHETQTNNEDTDGLIGATLPVVVNGRIMPAADDDSFTARKADRLVIAADAQKKK